MTSIRKVRTKAQWQQIITDWQDGGGRNVREFCQEHGFNETRFYAWRKTFGLNENKHDQAQSVATETKSTFKFLPIRLQETAEAKSIVESGKPGRIDIFFSNGAMVRFADCMSQERLDTLLKAIEGISC